MKSDFNVLSIYKLQFMRCESNLNHIIDLNTGMKILQILLKSKDTKLFYNYIFFLIECKSNVIM